ncbi:MAG: WG repeat-containing protein [Fodinibius sp.]|nr:WG repeat-containing protein [Fodinibius sp.]
MRLYPFIEDNKVGFLNTSMDTQIPAKFQFLNSPLWPYQFSEGLAAVNFFGRIGYINRKGKVVIEPTFDYASSFHNGTALIRENGQHGYINRSGDIIIEPQFDRATEFSEGLAAVKDHNRSKWGYINRDGDMVIPEQFRRCPEVPRGAGARSNVQTQRMGLYKYEGTDADRAQVHCSKIVFRRAGPSAASL